jgi:hypothetical protein
LDLAISISCKLLLRPNNSGLFGSWDFTWENNRATMQSPAASTNPRVGIWQQAQSRWQLVALPDQHGRGRKEICAARRGARVVEGATGGAPSRRDPARAGGRGHHTVSVSVTHPGRQAAVHGKQPSGCCLALALSRLVAGWRLRPAARGPGPDRGARSNPTTGALSLLSSSRRSLSRRQARTAGQAARLRGHHTFDTRQFHFRTGERTRSTHPLVEQREPSIIGDSARAAGSSY